MGLRGTRSESYTIEGLFVAAPLTLDRETETERRIDTTLFHFPTISVYASVFSGVALGIAQSAFDDLLLLGREKKASAARSSLRESPIFQSRLAELQAQLGAAQAYHHAVLSDVWQVVESTGVLAMPDRARIRLATTYAINEATTVMEQIYRLAGSNAIFNDQPFERRFRDIHAVSQQLQARHTNYENVGRFMLDLDVDGITM